MSIRRSWRLLNLDVFHANLHASALCDEQFGDDLDDDGLVKLYDDTVTLSPYYSTDRFHYAIDRPTCGTTTTATAAEISDHCEFLSALLVELDRCQTSCCQRYLWRTEHRHYFE